MTDDEQRQRQHWQELAEQLGIDGPSPVLPAEEKRLAKAAPAKPSLAPTRAATGEDASRTGFKKEERTLPAEDQSPSRGTTAFEETAAPSWQAEELPNKEPSGHPEAPSEVAPQRRQGRKSTRGTRPRRSSDQARPRDADDSKRPEEIIEEESAPRAHRRRKEEPGDHGASSEEVSTPADEDEPEEGQANPEVREEETDKDDLDTLTDWNVPSWTELIDSLYRPDR
jgi:hypothetical protein